jgi:hypothetical protein
VSPSTACGQGDSCEPAVDQARRAVGDGDQLPDDDSGERRRVILLQQAFGIFTAFDTMNRAILAFLLVTSATTLAGLGVLAPSSPVLVVADTASAIPEDHAFLEALAKRDRATETRLLHGDFSWIDSRGKRLTRSEFLESLPAPANADVVSEQRVYGDSAVIRADRGKVHVLRVWLKGATGWLLFLYQEVTQVEKSEPAGGVATTECENPCKTIPFQPQTQSEKDAVASWQGVMSAMASNDADAYAPLIAEEFTATDTYHDRPYTKADRLAQIEKQKASGARSAPPELVSAQMFDFGETVMMLAREQRNGAKAYFNTRMWVKRDTRWQMFFSFNTRIE